MTDPKTKRTTKSRTVEHAAPQPHGPEATDFEASIQRLGQIVEALEEGELPLEESLKLFEEGVHLARKSQKVLDDAEQRVEQLLSVDDEGNPIAREIQDPEE